MYIPQHFSESDIPRLQQYIRDYGFGLLIVADDTGIDANHVPFYLNCEHDSAVGRLHCHLARSNPVWQKLVNGGRVLAVFQGPDAYISPSWYPSKTENGRAVPTWNYLAVHAEGTARVIEDGDWLKQHVHQLTNQHESAMSKPWAVDDAPPDYIDRMVQAIVGIEITIEKLTGKLKASQNQPERNKAGVIAGLSAQHPMSKLIS
ncbi:MAG: FMN-binding negative transcriptional regulator [Pseudohongiella sp.]|nr:FMN-binding negative transcriptional regulator [Pseudohongiella sp.]